MDKNVDLNQVLFYNVWNSYRCENICNIVTSNIENCGLTVNL